MTDKPLADLVCDLANQPFPARYAAYRRDRPAPHLDAKRRIANPENLALLLVMSQNFDQFGVKRMGTILHWENIQVHHLLRYGMRCGHVERVSRTMFRTHNVEVLLQRLRTAVPTAVPEELPVAG